VRASDIQSGPDLERKNVLDAAAIELKVFIAIGMYTGLREADVCALTRQAYDGKRISTVAAKNGERISISVHFRLREILDEASPVRAARLTKRARRYKNGRTDPPMLAVTSRCQPWTPAGFRASFFKLVKRLEASAKVDPGLTFHGLRHTLGKLIMESGGSKEDVGMVLGDRSIAMAHFYSREHEKQTRVDLAVQRLEAVEYRPSKEG
jgi:integrase